MYKRQGYNCDCVSEPVFGCTDETAENYNADATADDGTCEYSCSEGVSVFCDGGSWQSEVSWSIIDCDGNTVAEGGAPFAPQCVVLPDAYTIVMNDSYGDGWNGNVLNIDGVEYTMSCSYPDCDTESVQVGECAAPCENVVVSCDGGFFQSEVGWTITDADGNIVASGGAPFDGTVCLEVDGCYDVNMADSYGDGWNGNVLNIGGAEFGLDSGSEGSGSFCMPIVVGCMDETACDYNPDATIPTDCDYTSCECDGDVVSVGGGSYQSEVSWTITDCDGNIIAEGGAPYEECVGELPADYVINMSDSWGDGWNGNVMTIGEMTYSIYDYAATATAVVLSLIHI